MSEGVGDHVGNLKKDLEHKRKRVEELEDSVKSLEQENAVLAASAKAVEKRYQERSSPDLVRFKLWISSHISDSPDYLTEQRLDEIFTKSEHVGLANLLMDLMWNIETHKRFKLP